MTRCERLAEYFRARPGEWLTMQELARVAGTGGWRTRISDLRLGRWRERVCFTFDQRDYDVTGDDGVTYRRSEYRYLPDSSIREKSPDLGSEGCARR